MSTPGTPPRNIPQTTALCAWVGLAILSIAFFFLYSDFSQDDAYITYRYARNLAAGLGFVYNAGEWVLGTTTPLYTLLLAAGARFTKLDVADISLCFGFISLWTSAGILYELGKSQNKIFAFSTALIFLTNPFLRHFVGMESYSLICLFLLTIWAYKNDKRTLTAFCSGLLILARYEMILVMCLICTADYVKRRRVPFWILPGFLPVSIWIAFAFIAFGSPIPLSASAKLMAPRVPFLVGAAVYWFRFIAEVHLSFAIIVFFLIGAFGITITKRSHQNYTLIIFCGIIYLCMASAVAGSFPWYYAPLIPGFSITVALGVIYVSRIPSVVDFGLDTEKKQQLERILLLSSVTLIVAIQLMFWGKDYQAYRDTVFDNRYLPYTEVSEWLGSHASTEQTIAAYEIGFIGYFSNMRVIDLAGLITPSLTPWAGDGAEISLYHSLRLHSPDFVLIPSASERQIEIVTSNPHYRLEREFSRRYLLYRKTTDQ